MIKAKKVLFVDLNKKTVEVKTFPDLGKYVGGIGVGLKLYSMYEARDPVVLSIGPLNGFFPYASKTAIVLGDNKVIEDIYIGGSLSFRIRFAGLDSIVFLGRSDAKVVVNVVDEQASFEGEGVDLSELGLPGKRSLFTLAGNQGAYEAVLDNYFISPRGLLARKLENKGISGVAVTGNKTFSINDTKKYERLFNVLLEKSKDMDVAFGDNPSCSGCPLGCVKSKTGEIGGNILAHSLVACDYASRIYSDANIVFSCLNVLGYDYRHEDIEAVPSLVEGVLSEL